MAEILNVIPDLTTPPAIIGEAVAGRSDAVRRQISKLIKATNTNTFDLAELMHEAKAHTFYTDWGYESFSRWAKSLDIKYSKAYYLVRIIEIMSTSGVPRDAFEPVGLGKLRIISKLDPSAQFRGVQVAQLIKELTLKAVTMTQEEVQFEVDTILGLTEDEFMVWLNIHVKKLARENVIRPAVALAKKHIGSVNVDDDGNAVDASDGAALEMICANFMADPNYNQETDPTTEQVEAPPEAQ
jgi:hypothetical protein